MFDAIIIGSGPSSVASLLQMKPNARVAVIEHTSTTPSEILAKQQELADLYSDSHDGPGSGALMLERYPYLAKSNFTVKPYWNSDFLYRRKVEHQPSISSARGGFSLVWGATAFPYTESDLMRMRDSFVSSFREQTSFIERVLHVAHEKIQGEMFASPATENFRPQAKIFHTLMRTKGQSENMVYEFEPTRLALASQSPNGNKIFDSGCINCGLCQLGCPTGVVWTSKNDFENLLASQPITVISGWVSKIEVCDEYVVAKVYKEGEFEEIRAKRILLTGGVASTAQLLVDSGIIPELRLLDSQTTLTLMWSLKKIKSGNSNLSLADTSLTTKGTECVTHTQLYTLNDYFIARLRNSYPLVRMIPKIVLRIFSRRLVFGFTYFQQEVSGQFKYTNQKWIESKSPDWRKIKMAFKNISIAALDAGLWLIPLRYHFPVGGGHHIGGEMFVKGMWEELNDQFWRIELDELARPMGYERVHVMDSTALGPIPTGSVTLASMVHTSLLASRINSELMD
jgi:ferredoxin